jgi:hypothetical protein
MLEGDSELCALWGKLRRQSLGNYGLNDIEK